MSVQEFKKVRGGWQGRRFSTLRNAKRVVTPTRQIGGR